MLAEYYLNLTSQPLSGDHEVHKEGCYWLSLASQVESLGNHYICDTAVTVAKTKHAWRRINGCAICCSPCHTS